MRLGGGKRHHYEFDARVPFLARGPGITAGTTPKWLTGNVDIAPTFLSLAGWRSASGETVPTQMDGRSFADLLMGPSASPVSSTSLLAVRDGHAASRPNRTEYLLEFTGMTNWPHNEGAGGKCPPTGCARLNDCPNNTYRGLRIGECSHATVIHLNNLVVPQRWPDMELLSDDAWVCHSL